MRICVFGAGAIGAFIGAELAAAGQQVSLVARGAHLAALQRHGVTVLGEKERRGLRIAVTDDPRELGVQDYVLATVKSHSLPQAAASMKPLLGRETAVVTMQNGIPWWYFYRSQSRWEGHRLESVDPGGTLWETLGPERAIGAVVYPSCEVVEPGVVRHLHGHRLMVGEPDGRRSRRVEGLAGALRNGGFKAPVRTRIRDDVWLKLWGNLAFNPISVLTAATLAQIGRDQPARRVVRLMMEEGRTVATALGVELPVDVDTRIDWAVDVGEHRTSMLQDLEAGRPLETGPVVAAVTELGRLVGVETPTIDAVLALVELRASCSLAPGAG